MFASVRRRDKVWISLNLDQVTYAYPGAPVPGDYAVVVLTTGEQIQLYHTFSEFVDLVERKETEHQAAAAPRPAGSGVGSWSPRPRPAGPGSGAIR